MTELVTIKTFCEKTQIKLCTVRYWRSIGELSPIPFVKIGKLVRIPASAIDDLVKQQLTRRK